MSSRPLINVNVPKGGRIVTRDVIRFAVIFVGLTAAWNWGPSIPGIGPYIGRGKDYIRRALGGSASPV